MNKKIFFNKVFIFSILILAAIILSVLLSGSVINNKIEKNIGQWPEIRYLDKNLIQEKIQQGKDYLLRTIDKNENGAHKYYYPTDDTFENKLYTIYTSSTIYTLLKIYNSEKDEELLKQIYNSADFILSMQNKEDKKVFGAFYYSYDLDIKEKELKYFTGTSAKTIFTLIKLYELSGDKKYLESAKLAGDWLLTMKKSNGSTKSYIRYDSESKKWFSGTKESLLYNGQVLSAFSRLYLATKEENYYKGAENIAKYLAGKYEEVGRNYIKDDYREINPISNSWVVMSLIDFYRAKKSDYYEKIVFEMANRILNDQMDDPNKLSTYGQWKGVYSTSGVGWISEVMSELYDFCQKENKNDCEKYKEAVVLATRWLVQNTYPKESMSGVKNPEMALGGIPWDQRQEYIRTDSVCHGLNSYLNIINELADSSLISITVSQP
ncbi:hypothetical protein KJ786_02910 [Patescibacteria group bacterium]|nr:hypothetical protein [Patescibacteria group bacterium]